MIREALLAVGFVLAASAMIGDDDWELVVSGQPPICTKDRQICEEGRTAIARGYLRSIPADAATACRPHPGCFSPESNCIQGYSC